MDVTVLRDVSGSKGFLAVVLEATVGKPYSPLLLQLHAHVMKRRVKFLCGG